MRVALCKKLISVPFEHLVKNSRLTNVCSSVVHDQMCLEHSFSILQYWYQESSIVASAALRSKPLQLSSSPLPYISCHCIEVLMGILFEVTELDFQLQVECSAFLDETWVIPVSPL